MTVQPNKPTAFNLKRLRVPYSRYSGLSEREGTKPVTPPVADTAPVSDEVQKLELGPATNPESNSAGVRQSNVAGPLLVDDQVLLSSDDELERYSKELEPVATGYKELLKEAEMGRLDERNGKGKLKRDVLNGLDGPRQLEMREYAQRMMNNVVRERKTMSEKEK